MQDHPGVLHRVVSLFRRRGYNIDSLTVGRSELPGVSRMTIVTEGSDVDQVTRQLFRLIEVLKVVDVTESATVEREIALVKVNAPGSVRAELVACCAVFGARTADLGPSTMVIEITGEPSEVDRCLDVLRPFGIKEMMRTGRIAMIRGSLAHEAAPELRADEKPPLLALAG
ncbi:MAG: acetolactate synthase small subunit [Gemmatimonadetes bacterium]|nr:acetolactate synthase small subunit [Gemmatimonadota bacterium]